MGWVVRTTAHMIYVLLTCEENRGHEKRYRFMSLENIARVPMIQPDVVAEAFHDDLEWSTDDGELEMINFKGSGDNLLEATSPSEAYWAQFCHTEIDLLRDHYQKGTNEWAAERKRLAIGENKLKSWWMKWPDEGVDINSIKLDIVLK